MNVPMKRMAIAMALGLAAAGIRAESAPATATSPATATAPALKITWVAAKPMAATSVSATGRVHAVTTAKVSPRISGHLVALGKDAAGKTLDAGMRVKKGDLLFSLDSTTYKNNEASATAALASAEAALANLKAPPRPERVEQLKQAIAELEARLEERQRDLERYKRLVEEKTAPGKRLEEARTEVTATAAQLSAARSRLAEAENGATKTEIAVAEARAKEVEAALKIARDDIRDTEIRAPFDALIVRRIKSVGNYIAANPPVEVFELIATDSLEAEIRVPESYFARITPGETTAKLSSPLLKKAMEATVSRVVADIDPARGTFPVRVAIPANSSLIPGAFVTAELSLAASTSAAIVPHRAVVSEGGKTFVFVAKDGKLARREVTVAERLTESVVISSGLAPGENVALAPADTLKEGLVATEAK